jgi:transcriptional regulator with XRE-family HTH domain
VVDTQRRRNGRLTASAVVTHSKRNRTLKRPLSGETDAGCREDHETSRHGLCVILCTRLSHPQSPAVMLLAAGGRPTLRSVEAEEMAREPEAIAELRRSLGTQLATFRLAAELTQGQLAKVAICDRTTIVHIEKGRARGDERFWRAVDDACDAGGALLGGYLELEAAKAEHERREREQRLATVRAKAAELRGRVGRGDDQGQRLPRPDTDDTVTRRFLPEVVSRLSDAMLAAGRRRSMSRQPVATADGGVLGLPELTTEVRRAWQLRQQAAYAVLGGHLAELIPNVEASAANLTGDDQYAAQKLIVHTYNAASSLLKRLGDIELALLAADRAVRAAHALDDSLLAAAATDLERLG